MNFFVFETDLPSGGGFSWYHPGHLAWLLGIAGAGVALGLWYRHCTPGGKRRLERTMAALMLGLEALWLGMLFFGGHLDVTMLPLHLCALSILLAVVHGFRPVGWIGEYLYAFGLPGAAAALFFPDWTAYPLASYYTVSSFLLHGLLVDYGAMLLLGGAVRPRMKNAWKPLLFVALVSIPMGLFNRHFGVNYMFLSVPSPGSPLEWVRGPLGYLPGYVLLVLAVELALYLPWALADRKKGPNKTNPH